MDADSEEISQKSTYCHRPHPSAMTWHDCESIGCMMCVLQQMPRVVLAVPTLVQYVVCTRTHYVRCMHAADSRCQICPSYAHLRISAMNCMKTRPQAADDLARVT